MEISLSIVYMKQPYSMIYFCSFTCIKLTAIYTLSDLNCSNLIHFAYMSRLAQIYFVLFFPIMLYVMEWIIMVSQRWHMLFAQLCFVLAHLQLIDATYIHVVQFGMSTAIFFTMIFNLM